MGVPQSPTPPPPHLYPHALQLKLYQAFIFSIPILFAIILVLLFYLFYLKKRASSFSTPLPILPRTTYQATAFIPSPFQIGWKGELKDNLPTVFFDEDLQTKGSVCCVCLGEFEMKEELLQVPSCKHMFHGDCIYHWLHSNATCPLCRCRVVAETKQGHDPEPLVAQPPTLQQDINNDSTNNQFIISLEQRRQQQQNQSIEQQIIPMEASTSTIECSRQPRETGHLDHETVVLHIPFHNS